MREAAPKRVTAADIAREIGVSRATVGFVLNNTPGQTISEATRQRVLDAATRLGYRPHSAARALASGRSQLVLLVLPDWPIEFSMRLYLEEAYRVLEDAGYALVTATRHAGTGTRPLWESLNPDVVVGFHPFDADDVASMRASGVGVIFPDPALPGDPGDIGTFAEGPRLQALHLHELGHRRLGFAAAPDLRVAALTEERARLAQDAARALDLPPLRVKTVDHRDGSARRAVEEWRAAGVTGVVAYNDDVAAEVVGAAVRAGVSVPAELAVIGHDDTPIASVFVPTLSSVRVDHAAAGRLVAHLALHQADGRPLPAPLEPLDAVVVARESTLGPMTRAPAATPMG
ncbi:LacI family DNA-binding transcriptional regulator [Cryptosporangium minutisporangium]|uniref:LacI family DNA-binding transcriptional regulator n=1 Tax=Cryptosporangium minutisporangium TaxID=113569 RepID=A0ABP6SS00_9ACTN